MKCFKIHAVLYGEVSYEDPNCPISWKGSGCYDITEAVNFDIMLLVWAKDEERAQDIIENASWDRNGEWSFDVAEILECEEIAEEEDGEEEIEVKEILNSRYLPEFFSFYESTLNSNVNKK